MSDVAVVESIVRRLRRIEDIQHNVLKISKVPCCENRNLTIIQILTVIKLYSI